MHAGSPERRTMSGTPLAALGASGFIEVPSTLNPMEGFGMFTKSSRAPMCLL